MNEAIEKINQFSRRRAAYEKAYTQSLISNLPTKSMHWIVQVDGTYQDRFASVLSRIQSMNRAQHGNIDFAVSPAAAENGMAQGIRHFEVVAALCFMKENVVAKGWLPSEFAKQIQKIMYCDRVCSDAETLVRYVKELLSSAKGPKLLKTLCSPKSLEYSLMRILADDLQQICQFTASESKFTHLLHVVYCPLTGNIHYGLVNREMAEANLLTSAALEKIKLGRSVKNGDRDNRGIPGKARPCRAYFKMSEVVESVLPSVGWSLGDLSSGDALAVDVGASPGGWSQCLAELGFAKVVAIDPGELRREVLEDQRIHHLQCLVEDPQVGRILSRLIQDPIYPFKGVSLIVCDVNFAPWLAAKTLAKHCFSFLDGFGDCDCCSCDSSCPPHSSSTARSRSPKPAYVVLTLKMLKHPRQHHIEQATEECKATMIASHQKRARKKGCYCLCRCWSFSLVHLAANSSNERTLIAKLH